jgi:transcriptional regulator with XRE-family HTH domain
VNNIAMNKTTTEFGIKCRVYREKLKLNMTQLAEKTGIKQSTITKIEQGSLSPTFDFIKKSISAYEIKDKTEQMDFLLSSLNNSEKIEIPLNELGPIRKEWLAALCILGDVQKYNPEGWDMLIDWTEELLNKLKDLKPTHSVLCSESHPL